MPSIEDALALADFVYSGTVLGITDSADRTDSKLEEKNWPSGTVHFQVDTVWKGVVTRDFDLRAAKGSCFFQFERGVKYLVFANKAKLHSGNWASKCLPTKRMCEAGCDLDKLRSGREPHS
jgi:hypothetical protein